MLTLKFLGVLKISVLTMNSNLFWVILLTIPVGHFTKYVNSALTEAIRKLGAILCNRVAILLLELYKILVCHLKLQHQICSAFVLNLKTLPVCQLNQLITGVRVWSSICYKKKNITHRQYKQLNFRL